MLKRFIFAVAAVLMTCTCPAYAAPAPQMTTQDVSALFDGLVPYAIHRADIAGAVVVVVRDGHIIFSKGYGYADVQKRTPVIADRTIFRPGSVSKLFTWTAVMQLVQAGKINLDADVNTYLDFKIPEKFGKITVRDLMTHTPGFAETIRDLFVSGPKSLYPLRQYLVRRIPDEIYPPGKVIAYSNYGAALAGYIVQRVSGEPFDQYIARHIFAPLHMTHSTFAQPLPPNLAPLMAKGYTTASADEPSPFEIVEAAPAGASSATGTDMAKFMMAYLNGGSYGGGTILKRSTIREMWALQVPTAPGLNGFDLGFYQENRNGRQIVGHGGDTDVFHSDLHLLTADNVGVFMSLNSAGQKGASEDVRVQIFRAFLNRYYPYTARQLPRVSTAKADAARVAGWYEASRREDRALPLVFALGETAVMPMPDGDIKVSMLVDPAGNPLRWHEVGPLLYQDTGGQSRVEFAKGFDGRLYFATSEVIPVFIFQRVNGLKALGSLKVLIPLFMLILVISLLVRLGRWIARRKLKLKKGMSRERNWLSLAARIGAVLLPGTLVAWVVFLSNEAGLLSPAFVTEVTALYVLGVIAIIGGVAIIAEAVMRILYGPGGWFVRTGEAVVALAAIYGIWLYIAFGLVSFVTNF